MTSVTQGHRQRPEMKQSKDQTLRLQTGGCILFSYSKNKILTDVKFWNMRGMSFFFPRRTRQIPNWHAQNVSSPDICCPKYSPKIFNKALSCKCIGWQDKGISACKLCLVKSYPSSGFEPEKNNYIKVRNCPLIIYICLQHLMQLFLLSFVGYIRWLLILWWRI